MVNKSRLFGLFVILVISSVLFVSAQESISNRERRLQQSDVLINRDAVYSASVGDKYLATASVCNNRNIEADEECDPSSSDNPITSSQKEACTRILEALPDGAIQGLEKSEVDIDNPYCIDCQCTAGKKPDKAPPVARPRPQPQIYCSPEKEAQIRGELQKIAEEFTKASKSKLNELCNHHKSGKIKLIKAIIEESMCPIDAQLYIDAINNACKKAGKKSGRGLGGWIVRGLDEILPRVITKPIGWLGTKCDDKTMFSENGCTEEGAKCRLWKGGDILEPIDGLIGWGGFDRFQIEGVCNEKCKCVRKDKYEEELEEEAVKE